MSELLLYASIPVTSAIVGWGTNVLALKMTFYPVEFIGPVWPLGWQGIIPAKAEKMARTTVDLITRKLVGVEEVFERLDPERVRAELSEGVAQLIRQTIDEAVHEQLPELWPQIPQGVKDEVYRRAKLDADRVVEAAMEDIKADIEDLLDLERMAVEALLADKTFLIEIFLECGREEFTFIERSGFVFGFVFGVVQMILWWLMPMGWMLPAAGFVVGWLTNVLALKMIFEPRRPKHVMGLELQGLFLKRQHEVAEAYARLIASQIVNTRNIIDAIAYGPAADKLMALVEGHVQDAVDAWSGPDGPLVRMVAGSDRYAEIKRRLVEKIVREVPHGPIHDLHDYAEEAMDIERTLRERLQALAPEDFEGLLRPIFQEDEYKLILIGAVLGLAVGCFQAFVVFG